MSTRNSFVKFYTYFCCYSFIIIRNASETGKKYRSRFLEGKNQNIKIYKCAKSGIIRTNAPLFCECTLLC